MQLDQTFTVAATPEVVWDAFHDPALLVSCLPGASLRGPVEADRLPLLFKVKLGPIAAAFNGEGTVTLDEATRSGTFAGLAADTRSNSRVKGEAAFSLAEDLAGGTRVTVTVNFTITGSLAQFSREGIVRALAEQLTRQFADNLQAELAAVEGTGTAAPVPAQDAKPTVSDFDADTAQALCLASAAGGGAMPWAVDTPVVEGPRADRPRPARRDEAPAINGFALLAAVIKSYWHRLIGKKTT